MVGSSQRLCLFLFLWIIFGSISAAAQSQSATTTDSGIESYRTGDYKVAIEFLKNAVAARKNDKYAWAYLGASYLHLGEEKAATRAFAKSNLSFRDKPELLDAPVKKLQSPQPTFTGSQQQNALGAEVKVAVEYKADGTIGFAFAFQALPDERTANCVRAARSIRFRPAVKNGVPVTTVNVVTYSFNIY